MKFKKLALNLMSGPSSRTDRWQKINRCDILVELNLEAVHTTLISLCGGCGQLLNEKNVAWTRFHSWERKKKK